MSKYNSLPLKIQKQFDVLYSEELNNNIILFRNKKEYWGVLRKQKGIFTTNYTSIVEAIYDSTYYEKNINFIVGVIFENKDTWLYKFFNLDGILISSLHAQRVKIEDNYIISENADAKYELLDDKFNVLIDNKDYLSSIGNNLFIFKENGKFGILNSFGKIIIPPVNVKIHSKVNNNRIIVESAINKYHIYNINGRIEQDLPYDNILSSTSNTYAAPCKIDEDKFKTVIGKKIDDYLEMTDFDGKWGIIDNDGKEIIPNEYNYIDFFRSKFFYKVGLGKMYLNHDTNDSFINIQDNIYLIVRDTKWGVINNKNDIIVPIEFEWVEEISDGKLWAINKGGQLYYNSDYEVNRWEILGGKWGVINSESKIIVPIKYDKVITSWFRVKSYIFVKNTSKDSNYYDFDDVYDFDGKLIMNNKPNIKDYMFQPSDEKDST